MRKFKYIGPEAAETTRDMVVLFENNKKVVATDIAIAETILSNNDIRLYYVIYSKEDWNKWYKEIETVHE
jgi:predicted secreted acid phosphatase